MSEALERTIGYFLFITAELTVLFIGISTLVALILMYVSQEKLKRWLSKPGLWGNFLGALFGSITPFCACSTIPMTLGLLNAGSPFGAVMSFIIASPLLNPIIISMIATLMGLKASIIYFVVTFIGSIIFGYTLEKIGGAKHVKQLHGNTPACDCSNEKPTISSCCETKAPTNSCCSATPPAIPANFSGRLKVAFKSACADFKAVLLFLLIGVGIGAAIYGYIPQEFIVKVAGPGNPFAIPIAAIVGIPLYIRTETAIPIGVALMQKGMSVGAVVALIIGGAGMAIPEMTMLASIFKKRLVAAIVMTVWATAVCGGYIFNSIL